MATTKIPLYSGSVPDIITDTDMQFSVNVEDINNYMSKVLPDAINTTTGEIDANSTLAENSATSADLSAKDAKASAKSALASAGATVYDLATTYNVNDVVIALNGSSYRCISASVGDEPSVSPSKWKNVFAMPLDALTDIPTKQIGKFLKVGDDGISLEWSVGDKIAITDVTDVPAKVANQFLKVSADGTTLEWATAYAVAIDEISADLQKVYTDTTSFAYIMENNTAPDMIIYMTMFREWFNVAGNSGFIDPLVNQNVFDNVMNSPRTIQFLATFDAGYDWIFDKISNAGYSASIIALIDAGSLDSIKTTQTFGVSDFNNPSYITRADILSQNKAYAYVSSVSVSNDTNTTYAHVSFESELGLIDTPEISIHANGTLTPTTYTTAQYGGLLSLQEIQLYAKVDTDVGIANMSVDVVTFARPTSIALPHDTEATSLCAIGDWACIVKEDLQKSIYDETSFSQKLLNNTTGNSLEYVSAYKTLANDATFINGLIIGQNPTKNILAVTSLLYVILSPSRGAVPLINFFGVNYSAIATEFKQAIDTAFASGVLSYTEDVIKTTLGVSKQYSSSKVVHSTSQIQAGSITFVSYFRASYYKGGGSAKYAYLYLRDVNGVINDSAGIRNSSASYNVSTSPMVSFVDADSTIDLTVDSYRNSAAATLYTII